MKKIVFTLLLTLICVAAFSALAAKPKARTETVTYVVSMHCQNCVNKLTDNLSFMKGVEDFRISLKDKTITIKYNPAKVQEKTFVETIEKLGYTVTNNQMKTLVAYFSATGTTEAVARDLAEVTRGTLYEIKPEVRYTAADLDWRDKTSRSSVEMQDRSSRPAIVKDMKDADSYDRIYIGFPVWWYTAPTIINTFIETYGFKGKKVTFFATSGGSSIDKANADFRKQYPEINWLDGKTLNSLSKAEIKKWADGLEQ